MATLSSNSIFGNISGKVGDVVYSSWKGIPYVRKRPLRISNPRTAGQLEQRAKFAAIIKFLKPLTPFIRVGFKSKNAKMSAHNSALSYNLANAIMGAYPDYAIDYSKVLISRGNIRAALSPSIRLISNCEIEFSWVYNPRDYNAYSDDKAVLVVYNYTKHEVITAMDGNSRINGSQAITLPPSFAGDSVHCYIAFQNYNQKVISNSLYVGCLILT